MSGVTLEFVVDGQTVLSGTQEYLTKDGFAGVRQAGGRLDEVPLSLCRIVRAPSCYQLIDTDSGEAEWEGSLAEFLDANTAGLTDEEIAEAKRLAAGEEMRMGGGASPTFTLRAMA